MNKWFTGIAVTIRELRRWHRKEVCMEKRMMKICEFYEYDIYREKDGGIKISNFIMPENVYRYHSAEELVKDWEFICEMTNKDYMENGMEKAFEWL